MTNDNDFRKKDNKKITKTFANLYWICDKNSHKTMVKSIVFNSLSDGQAAKVTLTSGRAGTFSFIDFVDLIEKIVVFIDAPRHKKEQMRRYLAAVKKKEMNAINSPVEGEKGAKNQ